MEIVGRAGGLAQLERVAGRGGSVEVVGEPGVGKTRLLAEFSAGRRALIGRATEFEAFPYGVFADAFDDDPLLRSGDVAAVFRAARLLLARRAPLALVLDRK